MINNLDWLIYLDENLIKNLNSVVLNGYIEKRTSKWIEDRTLSGSIRFSDREQYNNEDRTIRDERDGYKGKSINCAELNNDSHEIGKEVDGKRIVRREEELTRIYTTFELHQQLLNSLSQSNSIKSSKGMWSNDNVNEGDYVEVEGNIGSSSVLSYLNLYSNILGSVGSNNINSITNKNANLQSLNYDNVTNQVDYLNRMLSVNNTEDVIINTQSNNIVINYNKDFFVNAYGNIHEKVGCPCKIFGKVVKVYNEDEHIHLLRKTGHPSYFERILESHKALNYTMGENGIIVPEQPNLKVNGETMLIVPISICI